MDDPGGRAGMKSAICLIVRNERRDIAEWIAFHALAGFDTQIIFNHSSDDGTDLVIRFMARHYDIRIHDWQDHSAQSQLNAYNAALSAYRLEFDWLAFLDSDEFFIPAHEEPVNNFLERYQDWSGIAIPWAVYGSNGHVGYPPKLVIESFTRRAPENFFPSHHVKSIIRPRFAAAAVNPHCFDLAGHIAGSYCDLAGATIRWWPAPERGGVLPGVLADLPDYSIARVNHYFTRSRAHWQAKIKRGYPSDMVVRKEEEFAHYDRNEILDPIALRYVPRLREARSRLNNGA